MKRPKGSRGQQKKAGVCTPGFYGSMLHLLTINERFLLCRPIRAFFYGQTRGGFRWPALPREQPPP